MIQPRHLRFLKNIASQCPKARSLDVFRGVRYPLFAFRLGSQSKRPVQVFRPSLKRSATFCRSLALVDQLWGWAICCGFNFGLHQHQDTFDNPIVCYRSSLFSTRSCSTRDGIAQGRFRPTRIPKDA